MSQNSTDFRVIFAGTPETAVPSLNALVDAGVTVVGVLTRPDAPLGRKKVLTPSPVARRAVELDLPVIKASRLTGEEGRKSLDELAALNPDLAVVVAYGGLIPQHGLTLPRKGWINLHFSLLPKYRGAAPVQHAVINNEPVTGSCVFQIEAGLDTGPVFSCEERPLQLGETSGEVLSDLSQTGAHQLVTTVQAIAAGTAQAEPQQGEPQEAPKLGQSDGHIDPAQAVRAVVARINGTTPEPGAWARLDDEDGARLKIGGATLATEVTTDGHTPGDLIPQKKGLYLVCDDGVAELVRVQPAGKKMMAGADFGRGLGPVGSGHAEKNGDKNGDSKNTARLRTSLSHPDEFENLQEKL